MSICHIHHFFISRDMVKAENNWDSFIEGGIIHGKAQCYDPADNSFLPVLSGWLCGNTGTPIHTCVFNKIIPLGE